MPIYEFRCTKCGNKFDKLCQLNESGENISCPKCHAPKPTRVMSGFSANIPGNLQGSRGDSCSGCTSRNCDACR